MTPSVGLYSGISESLRDSCTVVNKLVLSKHVDNSKCRLCLYQLTAVAYSGGGGDGATATNPHFRSDREFLWIIFICFCKLCNFVIEL